MRSLLSTLALAFYAAAAAANVSLEPRQGTAALSNVTCGRASYTKQQVDAAVAEGCRLHAAGDQLGSSQYPHRFNNRESLTFAVAGPYQEFPILASGAVYSGKAPGADRVVFKANYQGSCVYVGAMTHTDAPTRNGFVECVEAASGGGGSTATTASRPVSATSSSTVSGTSSTSSTATATSTADPDTNAAAAQGRVGMGGQGVVLGVVAGLLML
ncbi:Ribonuclease/ribotoxin [Parachaetomium inaequale]|uniref:ribonuclease T1 n=1 Tax=Parachaetomium inaequale TaxID=2588326 RepID=A0AAN6PEQ8_9PEZI|nr:Ribonuclease/ribotoxin [Parachaetomium inaequale]